MSKIEVVDSSYAESQVIKGLPKRASYMIVSDSHAEKKEKKPRIERSDAMLLDEC